MSILRSLLCVLLFVALSQAGKASTTPQVADFSLEVIKPDQGRVHFYLAQWQKAGCPSQKLECQTKAYLVPGDIVVLNSDSNANTLTLDADIDAGIDNGFIGVTYRAPPANSFGYVPTAALRPAHLLGLPRDFAGNWVNGYVRSNLKITVDHGQLFVDGNASWQPINPDAGPHTGEVSGPLALNGDETRYDDGVCQLLMKRAGIYLFVQDNGRCGGMNVFFTGFYQRTKG
jgi:hypothetical protein